LPPTLPQPYNFISIILVNESVKGTFVVDPNIVVPPTLLPPLEDGTQEEDRKNVQLQSTNGSVDVTVILVKDAKPSTKRPTVHVQSRHGPVTAKLVSIIFILSFSPSSYLSSTSSHLQIDQGSI
jgi:hypothetical protein